jgi:hypothetical protein
MTDAAAKLKYGDVTGARVIGRNCIFFYGL